MKPPTYFTLRIGDKTFDAVQKEDGMWRVTFPGGSLRTHGPRSHVAEMIAETAKRLEKESK